MPKVSSGTVQDELGSSEYPYVYVNTAGKKVATVFSLIIICACSLVILWFVYAKPGLDLSQVIGRVILFFLLVVVVGLRKVVKTWRYKVILRADAIEIHALSSIKIIRRDYIDSWQILTAKGKKKIKLQLMGAQQKRLAFSIETGVNPLFELACEEWFANLRPKDMETKAALDEKAFLEKTVAAYASQDGEAPSVSGQRFEVATTFVTISAFVVAMFYPEFDPVPVWILLAMPWVAIVMNLLRRGPFAFGQTSSPVIKTDLFMVILLPTIALMPRVVFGEVYMLNWSEVLVPGLALVVSMLVLIGFANTWYYSPFNAWSYLFICSIYVVLAIACINEKADQSSPRIFPVKILARRQAFANEVTSYYLTISAWGPRNQGRELAVSKAYYRQKAVGNTICVRLYDGFYRMPWYSVGDCTESVMLK